MARPRLLSVVSFALLCLGVGLRLGIDVLSIILRQSGQSLWSEGREELNVTLAITVLMIAGALLSLPGQMRPAAESGRPLFAGPGAIVCVAISLLCLILIAVTGGANMAIMAGELIWGGIGDHVGAMAAVLIVSGLAVMAGRTSATAGAILVAPVAMLALSAFVLESGITTAATAVALFMLVAAAGLLPPSLVRQSPALAVWPVAATLAAIFGGLLWPGLVTPGELAALLAVPAILIGVVFYTSATGVSRNAWLERAACEAGAVVLGLVALQLVSMVFVAVEPIDGTMRRLLKGAPMIGLAVMVAAYVALALFTSPVAALSIVLVAFLGAARIDVPKDLLVGELTLGTLLAMTAQATFLQPAPAGDRFALPRPFGIAAIAVILILMVVFAVRAG